MTKEELLKYNGQDGQPVYISYKGTIYDVTLSKFWKTGKHLSRHDSGFDITEFLKYAPHGEAVFSRFPVIGKLEDSKNKDSLSKLELLQKLYQKFHPHPVFIHYPIALSLFSVVMQLLFFLTENQLFEFAAFLSLLFYTLTIFPAIVSGLVSWIINYGASFTLIFKVKLTLSILFLLSSILISYLRIDKGLEIVSFTEFDILYNSLLFSNSIIVFIIAYFGGKITWPN